jgi:hypothetical protein
MENSMAKIGSGRFGDSEISNLIDIKRNSKEDNNDQKHQESSVDFLQEDRIALQKYIIKNLVIPNYVADLKSTFLWRNRWQKIGRVFFWSSNIFLLLSGMFSFVQVRLPGTSLFSMLAGICNILTFMLLNFGSDAKKESRLLTSDTNTLLHSVGLNALNVPQSQENNFVSTVTKPTGNN